MRTLAQILALVCLLLGALGSLGAIAGIIDWRDATTGSTSLGVIYLILRDSMTEGRR